MLRTILVAVYVVVLLVLSIPYMLIAKLCNALGLKGMYDTLIRVFVGFFGESVLFIAGVKVEVSGLENLPKRNVLFVGNHQSIVDIPLMLGFIPGIKSFIAKKETAKLPIIKWWMKEINCVFLDRQNIRQGIKDMAKAKEFLESGTSLVIYPEGTRSKTGEIGEFKKGSLKIAVQANVPVVPVAVSGSSLVFEKDRLVRKAKVKMAVGEPIYIDKLTQEQQKDIAEIAYERVKTLFNQIQTP